MAEIKLAGAARSEFGKGAARRLRRAGQVPAVLYGHGSDPVHLSLPAHDTQLALRQANALLSISIDGGKAQLALPKQVQRDAIKGFIEHVDLVMVKVGEKVHVEVPVTLVGEPEPGCVAMLDLNTVTVIAPATSIPNGIDINIDRAPAGTQITLGDLVLPEGAEVAGDADTLVVNVTLPRAASETESADGEAEAAEEADAEA